MRFISCYITVLVITSIRGGQTDTYRYTQVMDNIDFYKPGTWFKNYVECIVDCGPLSDNP